MLLLLLLRLFMDNMNQLSDEMNNYMKKSHDPS